MSLDAYDVEIITYIFIEDTWVNSSEKIKERHSFCSVQLLEMREENKSSVKVNFGLLVSEILPIDWIKREHLK